MAFEIFLKIEVIFIQLEKFYINFPFVQNMTSWVTIKYIRIENQQINAIYNRNKNTSKVSVYSMIGSDSPTELLEARRWWVLQQTNIEPSSRN